MVYLSFLFSLSFIYTLCIIKLPQKVPVLGVQSGGYVGYVLPISFAFSSLFLFSKAPEVTAQTLVGGALFSSIAILEDVFNLNKILSLFLKITAAVFLFSLGVRVDSAYVLFSRVSLGFWLSLLFSVFFIFSTVSSLGGIEGCEALCPAVAVSVLSVLTFALRAKESGSLFVSGVLFAILSAVLAAALDSKAIVLGRAGRYFIGSSLCVLSVNAFGGEMSGGVFLLLFFFSIDFSFALILRLFFRKKGVGGVYSFLIKIGFSDMGAVFFLSLFSLAVGSFAFFDFF